MILLDTHVWIWWLTEPAKLSAPARRAIDYAKTLGLCTISIWEISTLEALGRIQFDRPLVVWVQQMLAQPRVQIFEILPEIAMRAGQMGREGFHGDPADRMIVTTARFHGIPLVTKDGLIREYSGVETIW